jgi:hypothetical protein
MTENGDQAISGCLDPVVAVALVPLRLFFKLKFSQVAIFSLSLSLSLSQPASRALGVAKWPFIIIYYYLLLP